MSETYETDDKEIERAILVGVWVRGQNEEWEVRDTLDELAQLAEGAGAEVLERLHDTLSKGESIIAAGAGNPPMGPPLVTEHAISARA